MSYESLSAGALSVGRGYDPSAISGDSGVMGAAELHLGPLRLAEPIPVFRPLIREGTAEGLVFFDNAYVKRLGAFGGTSSETSLKSVGAGVSVQLGPRLRADITYAKPLVSLGKAGPTPPGRWLVRLIAIGF